MWWSPHPGSTPSSRRVGEERTVTSADTRRRLPTARHAGRGAQLRDRGALASGFSSTHEESDDVRRGRRQWESGQGAACGRAGGAQTPNALRGTDGNCSFAIGTPISPNQRSRSFRSERLGLTELSNALQFPKPARLCRNISTFRAGGADTLVS